MSIFLGFDTSNYTTSAAAVGGGFIKSERKILEVKEGQRGLRQSDAVFLHIKNMPSTYGALVNDINVDEIKGVGVSTKPRNVEGSYMPVFLAGKSYAEITAATLKVPIFEYSHQDGHIMAGIISGGNEKLLDKKFLSVHLSGGTTEILKSEYNGYNFENEIVGGTKDISAGQLIDRIGVLLGIKFPCGKQLERLAQGAESYVNTKVCTDGGYANFSGAETALARMDISPEEKAKSTLVHVARTLAAMLNNVVKSEKTEDILIVGGVASNEFIRDFLINNVNGKIYFAANEYSTDNAVGIAALAEKGGR